MKTTLKTTLKVAVMLAAFIACLPGVIIGMAFVLCAEGFEFGADLVLQFKRNVRNW